LEISSSQFIIKLLYKELNGVIAKRTCVWCRLGGEQRPWRYSVLANVPESTTGKTRKQFHWKVRSQLNLLSNTTRRKSLKENYDSKNQSSSKDSCAATTVSNLPRSWKGISEKLQKWSAN
jgi:hypothetical protein